MTEEEYRKIMDEVHEYYNEIMEHNTRLISELELTNDFADLVDCTRVTEKIEVVGKPEFKPENNPDVFGKLTLTHVDQRSVGDSGDSFCGFMYAKIEGEEKWLKIPYEI